jgi:hypothetical protein
VGGPSHQREQFLSDLRALVNDCFEGIRRQDPPAAWEARLARIAELSERLRRMDQHQGEPPMDPDRAAPDR